jgi:hypothetical protein
MTAIELSPDNILVFVIEAILDAIQLSTALSYNGVSEESILIFKAQSNCPTRYTTSPNVVVVHNNQTSFILEELVSS